MSWIFLTNSSSEREVMDMRITTRTPQLESNIDAYVNLID